MTQHKTDSKQLTVGEMLELAKGLKEMGVLRGKFGDFEFEFALAFSTDNPTRFMTPEEYEEAARKVRKEIEEEAFAAS